MAEVFGGVLWTLSVLSVLSVLFVLVVLWPPTYIADFLAISPATTSAALGLWVMLQFSG